MNTINISTATAKSEILIGEKLGNLSKYIPKSKVIIVTDDLVKSLYGKKFPDFPIVVIGQGEQNKTIQTIEFIFEKFLEHEVDRSWYVVAIGGGIVCDVAGFAASVYMRGLRFGFVSTTLLSQVDASVGGKNGVNFQGFKNMVGVFNQPEFVICDLEMLKTLDNSEFIGGFAEIIKAALIRKHELLEYIEQNYKKALAYDTEVLNKLVYESVLMKAEVVRKDEREKGERKILNFGHTFAHSFEKHLKIKHGEAVSVGMVLASKLSAKLGLISESDANRVETLCKNMGLPVTLEFDLELILSGMKKDKKREGESIHLILLDKPGNAIIKSITIKNLEELVNDLHRNI